jgi:hypothetical protein
MKIQCLCCKERKEKQKLKGVHSLFPFDGFMSSNEQGYLDSFMMIISKYPDLYQWACDDCINDQKAILANPKKQNYTFKHPMDTWSPFLAYFDQKFKCKICKNKTVFSKEEQQHWYEELSFVVFSKPTACKQCRKELRLAKNLNTELSKLLENGTPKEKKDLLRLAEIYEGMGKIEKMKKYLNAANKK